MKKNFAATLTVLLLVGTSLSWSQLSFADDLQPDSTNNGGTGGSSHPPEGGGGTGGSQHPPQHPPQPECERYVEQAYAIVNDGDTQPWEYEYALRVCSPEAIEAILEIRDECFYNWEMAWAVEVNNPYALAAFRRITDSEYSEWELKWVTYIQSERALYRFENLYDSRRYTEAELRDVCLSR